MQVLLIEDNEDDAYLIQEMLEERRDMDTQLTWVVSLGGGLKHLSGGQADVVLLDLSLPDSYGLETFDAVQRHVQDAPIVVLTGLDDESVASQAVGRGAQDYLVKGRLDSSLLSRAIRYALQRKQAERALRSSEAQLRQAQKMESIGRLAGGIAHDFNNLLTVINSYSEMLLGEAGFDDPFLRNGLDQIKEAGHRAASLTRQLLAFSRQQVIEPRVLDLNEVVANLAKLLRRLIGEDISLILCPHPQLGRIKADPGQVEQIIMNLAVNARDAMPSGGQLTIETLNAEEEAGSMRDTSIAPGSYVVLAVSDTGYGMGAETLARIFEPFFTTKEPGKGTGLGLATVDGIVKQNNGAVSVSSTVGKGTTFRVYLPRIEAAVTNVVLQSVGEAPRGAETILLVEDDEMVRALAQALLERYGYTVVATRHVKDALRFAEERSNRFDLLLTDTIMPGMNGPDLAREIRTLRPEAKVLYMSGYTDRTFTGSWEPGTPFLHKPFTPHSLTHKVRETLACRAHGRSGDEAA